MNNQKYFKLILNSKIYQIPSDVVTTSNVDEKIYHTLIVDEKYDVKSKVTDYVFQQFIDHWVDQKIPDINFDNIIQFDQLANEFDRMKDLVRIYQKHFLSTNIYLFKEQNDLLKKKLNYFSKKYDKKTTKYNQTIENILNNRYFILPR